MFRSSHFSFLVFSHFWRQSYENTKILCNLCFFLEKSFLGNEEEEYARRRPGVYFRLERDLYSRKDQFGVEIRERAKWDIRESMVGTETFEPKHIAIATWKNVSFAGGITSASRIVS